MHKKEKSMQILLMFSGCLQQKNLPSNLGKQVCKSLKTILTIIPKRLLLKDKHQRKYHIQYTYQD